MRLLAGFILKLLGWKVDIDTDYFKDKKCIVLGAPHTSNWDGFYAFLTVTTTKLPFKVMIKQEAVKGPFANFMRNAGAYPIDRSKGQSVVSQILEIFKSDEPVMLAIAPEGTRKRVEYWKSGFYRIAEQAKVPIYLGIMDYEKKIVAIKKEFVEATGNYTADMDKIRAVYQGVKPKIPSFFAEPKMKEETKDS